MVAAGTSGWAHGGGRVVTLNGPGSQVLKLEGSGTQTFPTTPGAGVGTTFAWEPEKNEDGSQPVQEIELRARIVSVLTSLPGPPALGDIPLVRYSTETSHGGTAWTEPHAALPLVAGSPLVDFTLPARGMVWRMAATKFRITFTNIGTILGAPMPQTEVLVSVVPAFGSRVGMPAYQVVDNAPGQVVPFPMEARTFQFHNDIGLPAPATPVIFTGLLGALIGPTTADLYPDPTPIPMNAVGWSSGVPVAGFLYATYQIGE